MHALTHELMTWRLRCDGRVLEQRLESQKDVKSRNHAVCLWLQPPLCMVSVRMRGAHLQKGH